MHLNFYMQVYGTVNIIFVVVTMGQTKFRIKLFRSFLETISTFIRHLTGLQLLQIL